MITLGCRWTIEYLLTGLAGGIVAVLILPGCYVSLPRIRRENDEVRVYGGAVARLIVAAIAGCIVDCNVRNAFFGGFFSWHAFRWLSEDGWKYIRRRLQPQKGE